MNVSALRNMMASWILRYGCCLKGRQLSKQIRDSTAQALIITKTRRLMLLSQFLGAVASLCLWKAWGPNLTRSSLHGTIAAQASASGYILLTCTLHHCIQSAVNGKSCTTLGADRIHALAFQRSSCVPARSCIKPSKQLTMWLTFLRTPSVLSRSSSLRTVALGNSLENCSSRSSSISYRTVTMASETSTIRNQLVGYGRYPAACT